MMRMMCAALALGSLAAPVRACDYAGLYGLAEDVVIRVSCRGAGLRVDRFGFASRSLVPAGPDRFRSADGLWHFRRDAGGRVTGSVQQRDGRAVTWLRQGSKDRLAPGIRR